jgi:hypothetical protein
MAICTVRGSRPLYAVAALATTLAFGMAGAVATAHADNTAGPPDDPAKDVITEQIVINTGEMTSAVIPVDPSWGALQCIPSDVACFAASANAGTPPPFSGLPQPQLPGGIQSQNFECVPGRVVEDEFSRAGLAPPYVEVCMPTNLPEPRLGLPNPA